MKLSKLHLKALRAIGDSNKEAFDKLPKGLLGPLAAHGLIRPIFPTVRPTGYIILPAGLQLLRQQKEEPPHDQTCPSRHRSHPARQRARSKG